MNGTIWQPGAVDVKQLSAAERETARVALNEHVELLTQKHNQLVTAVTGLLAREQPAQEAAAEASVTLDTLTASLAGTNVQVAAILDRLTALDSHEDRIERMEKIVERLDRVADAQHDRLGDLTYRAGVIERSVEATNTRTVWQRLRAVFAR